MAIARAAPVDAAVAAAASLHVPIDVMPLHYDVQNAVMVERFIAPTWKRENEPFTIDVILRSTGCKPITGKLEVDHRTDGGSEVLERAPACDRGAATGTAGARGARGPCPRHPRSAMRRVRAAGHPAPLSVRRSGVGARCTPVVMRRRPRG